MAKLQSSHRLLLKERTLKAKDKKLFFFLLGGSRGT